MAIELFYHGKKFADVKGEKIVFTMKEADLNDYLDSLSTITTEETEDGITLFVKNPLTLDKKLLELGRIGFEIKGES